jgi:hypothetical protein
MNVVKSEVCLEQKRIKADITLVNSIKPGNVRMIAAVWKTNVRVRFVHCAVICYKFQH